MAAGRPTPRTRTALGERLYAARITRGLSQQELADLVGANQQAIAYWERRAKTFRSDMIVKLSKALDVAADELLGIKRPRKSGSSGPTGRLRRVLQAAGQLPRHQQEKIVDVVEAFVEKKTAK